MPINKIWDHQLSFDLSSLHTRPETVYQVIFKGDKSLKSLFLESYVEMLINYHNGEAQISSALIIGNFQRLVAGLNEVWVLLLSFFLSAKCPSAALQTEQWTPVGWLRMEESTYSYMIVCLFCFLVLVAELWLNSLYWNYNQLRL